MTGTAKHVSICTLLSFRMEILSKTRRAWPLQPWAWIMASQNYLCYQFLFFHCTTSVFSFSFLFRWSFLPFFFNNRYSRQRRDYGIWWRIGVVLHWYTGANSSQGVETYHWKAMEKGSVDMNGMELAEWKEYSLCYGMLRRINGMEADMEWRFRGEVRTRNRNRM